MSRYPVIDTHVHFWNMHNPDSGMSWPWLAPDAIHPILGNIDPIKVLTYDVESLWAEARFADVSAFVHVEAGNVSDDPVNETVWLTRMREHAPVPFTIIGHVELGSDDAFRQLDGHCESPYFVGIRDLQSESILESGELVSTFEKALQLMSERSLVFDLDCEWPNMAAARDLALRHPGLTVVLDHVGFPRSRDDEYFLHWAEGLRTLALAPNVTCKVSGLAMTDPRFTKESLRRWIDTPLDVFGPERCVLGSNWPVDRLFSSYDVIMNVYRQRLAERFNAEDQRKVLSENAAVIFRL